MRGQWMGLLLILFSSAAYAQSFEGVVVSGDTGLVTIEEIGRAADGWPEKRRTHTFNDEQTAANFLRAAFPARREVRPEGGSALKGVGIPLWNATREWDWNWERKFAEWIRRDVDKDYFVRYNLATDCADVAYALRWIFARENGLPMASRLASGDWFNERTMRAHWLKLPVAKEWYNDKRFRAALDYILDFTYTHTLAQDAYPTAVNADAILEGGFHLELHGIMGHTQPFTHIRRPGEKGLPIYILDSTIPRKVRPLHSTGYWVMVSPQPGKGGLLRFRWPEKSGRKLIAPAKMPFYSEEQYSSAFKNEDEAGHYQAVFRHLDPSLTLEEIANELLISLKDGVAQRIQVVEEGYKFCLTQACMPGSASFENWSTPSRDGRLDSLFSELTNFIVRIGSAGNAITAELARTALTLNGVDYTYNNLAWAWRNDTFSSDPRLTPARRWGVSPEAVDGYIREVARAKWAERETFLTATSDCPATMCVPGLPEWTKNSSVSIDAKLLRLTQLASGYCANAAFNACRDFQRRMDAGFDLRDPSWTLRRTLDSFLTLLSDPRLSAAERRNGRAKSVQLLPETIAASTSAQFMRIGDSPVTLMDLRGPVPREILPPAGNVWLNADLTKARAWHHGPAGTFERDLQTGNERAIALPFQPNRVVNAGGGTLFFGKNIWAAVDAAGVVRDGGAYDFAKVRDTFAFIRSNGVTAVLEPDGGRGVNRTVALAADDVLPETIFAADAGWFYNSPTGAAFLRRDGRRVEYPDSKSIVLVGADGQTMFGEGVTGQVMVYTLGPGGEVLDMKGRAGVPNILGADWPSIAFSEPGGILRYYYLQDGRMVHAETMSGEIMIAFVAGDLVLAHTLNGVYIRRLDGTPLYKLPHHHFVNQFYAGSGFISLCSFPTEITIETISSSCRVENVFRPDEFSFATGLSMSPQLWRFKPFTFERGLRMNVSETSVWMEF